MEDIKNKEITLNVSVSNLDLYIDKAKQYIELLKEAKSLAEELASVRFEIELNQNLGKNDNE